MKKSVMFNLAGTLICISFCYLLMYPLISVLIKSFRDQGIGNYIYVFNEVKIISNFITSIIVVSGTLILVCIITSLAAFAFSRLNFPGKNLVYYILLSAMMIPVAAILFPLFFIVKGLRLINTPWSLIMPYATLNSIFNLMVLKNFYDALPGELMEAATIDGANTFGIFFKIMLPISIPGLSIVIIQTFLTSWNELQMAMTFLNKQSIQPVSVVPLRFVITAGATMPIEYLYASLVVCLSPIALFYIFAQKLLIKGLSQGAVKG